MYLPNWVTRRVPERILTRDERFVIAAKIQEMLGRFDTNAFHEVYSRQNAVRP